MLSFSQAFSLAGEIAVITGGGTGIGFGTAQAFVAAGARAVTDTATAPQLIERIVKKAGRPSILVNNAGIHLKKAAVETTEAEFNSVMNTHVTAAFALSRAAAQVMIERGGGNLIFMASMASLMGIPKVVAYSAAKSAYLGLVRSLAVELAPHGIRVNAIAPGWIETPMLHKAMESDPRRKARVLERTPMGRLGHPEDIGWAAAYLCSPAAGFVNGVVLPVDGGAAIGF